MEDFCIDTIGAHNSDDEGEVINKNWSDDDQESSDGLNYEERIPLDDLSDGESKKKLGGKKKASSNGSNSNFKSAYGGKQSIKSEKLSFVNKLLEEKSAIKPGLEKLYSVPMPVTSKRLLLKEQKKMENTTKGKDWYNIPATEVTEEIKNDLDVLRMRRVLDSKHVYKHNDMEILPKFFQIGKVTEGAADFYNGRIPKAQRKQTLVEELLADAEFKAYQKKKYKEIVDDSRNKKFRKAYKKLQRQKKREKKTSKGKKRRIQDAF